ncbi:dienelactone hydrolase family protein [Hephaestia sp. GCM10023244]|uniref:dienelactone hydrolase family protein n=1 Tax=unclassified Hephaestia TaxID=2631281 RepID=UPI00207784C8|nr:dienelactone hydrolase family protein [Hephaestia sp. MAHUQ-44]MCM8730602.1 dienelactone hydrolase family protein [Hephaestia sp. MAHUQ-44]
MTTGTMIRMAMADGADIQVYHVAPTRARRGGLVVVQEIFGITGHIRAVADGFARDGYEVLAPALFDREAPGLAAGYEGRNLARAITLARTHPIDQSVGDVGTCVAALADKGPVFVVGYCYGGSITWLAATRLEGVAAASGYYGRLIPAHLDETPRAPVILHFGRRDSSIPPAEVQKVIDADPPQTAIHLYDAGHGFNSDRRKDYDAPSAALARARTLELFRAHGG